jgi:hypothetical protein
MYKEPMNKASRITLVIIILTVIGYLLSFLIPVPPGWTGDLPSFRWALADSILYSLLHIGAAVLFLVGVSAYKATLRKAYSAIALGIVLVGAGLAQVVLINTLGLLQTPWVQYGGVMLPFVAAGLAIYLGTRSMANLIGIDSPFAKLKIVVPLLLVGIAIASSLPHNSSSLPELFFDISNAISVWDLVLYGASLGLVFQIKNRSGAYYTSSMAWLAIGLIGSVAITTTILIGTFIMGEQPGGYFLDTIVIIGGLLYLKAGHSFAKTKEL